MSGLRPACHVKCERAGCNDIWCAVSSEELNVSEILSCRGGNNIGLFFRLELRSGSRGGKTLCLGRRDMNKIDFSDDDLSIQKFLGEGLTDDAYKIRPSDFSLLLDLDYQKIEEGYERRTRKRFQVKVHAFALVRSASSQPICLIDKSMGEIASGVFRSKPIKLGRINNISMGGLVFRYIESRAQSNESSVLDILSADCGFYLGNVSFKAISDIELSEDAPIDSIKMKQLRVQFKKMTPNQKIQLDYLIRNHGSEV
jgi:hypothetical protein